MKKSTQLILLLFAYMSISTVYGQWVTDANGNVSIDRASSTIPTSVIIKNSIPGLYKQSSLQIGDYKFAQNWGGPYNGTGSFFISNSTLPNTAAKITMNNGLIGFSSQATGNLLSNYAVMNSPAKYFFDTLSAMNRLYVGDVNNILPTVPFNQYNFGVRGNSLFQGKVAIGVTNQTLLGTHKLYVGGSIICEELVVKLQASWPDFVFASNYKLMPLSEVKTYISENNHLPNVPAACEVEENGVATGEMLTIQMKKIEELTLYMIQMQEANEAMQKTNAALLKRIEVLESK